VLNLYTQTSIEPTVNKPEENPSANSSPNNSAAQPVVAPAGKISRNEAQADYDKKFKISIDLGTKLSNAINALPPYPSVAQEASLSGLRDEFNAAAKQTIQAWNTLQNCNGSSECQPASAQPANAANTGAESGAAKTPENSTASTKPFVFVLLPQSNNAPPASGQLTRVPSGYSWVCTQGSGSSWGCFNFFPSSNTGKTTITIPYGSLLESGTVPITYELIEAVCRFQPGSSPSQIDGFDCTTPGGRKSTLNFSPSFRVHNDLSRTSTFRFSSFSADETPALSAPATGGNTSHLSPEVACRLRDLQKEIHFKYRKDYDFEFSCSPQRKPADGNRLLGNLFFQAKYTWEHAESSPNSVTPSGEPGNPSIDFSSFMQAPNYVPRVITVTGPENAPTLDGLRFGSTVVAPNVPIPGDTTFKLDLSHILPAPTQSQSSNQPTGIKLTVSGTALDSSATTANAEGPIGFCSESSLFPCEFAQNYMIYTSQFNPQSATAMPDKKIIQGAKNGTWTAKPNLQFGADGGASFFNSNRPAFFDINGAVLWGGRNQIGLIAGYGHTNSAPAGSIGGHAAGQTFVDQTLSSKTGMFGAEFARETWGVAKLELMVGADVVGQTISNAAGFCGFGNATSLAGCHIFTTKTTHNTGVGSFVGGGFSYKLTHGFSLTTGLRYDTQPSIKSPASSASNIGVNRVTVFGGLQFNYDFGRHRDKGLGPFAP
jgi:hypothetical protein